MQFQQLARNSTSLLGMEPVEGANPAQAEGSSRWSRRKRSDTSSSVRPDSHTNYRWLSPMETKERLQAVQSAARRVPAKQHHIAALIEQSINVDTYFIDDLVAMMKETSSSVFSPGSFPRLFWESQERAIHLTNSKSV